MQNITVSFPSVGGGSQSIDCPTSAIPVMDLRHDDNFFIEAKMVLFEHPVRARFKLGTRDDLITAEFVGFRMAQP